MEIPANTHSVAIGYLLWLFGFTGSHRFYYGKPVTGTIWFLTLGLLGIGWLIDLFLIPSHGPGIRPALPFRAGQLQYRLDSSDIPRSVRIHRMYMGKWITGIIYLFSGALFGIGYIYDYWTMNNQITEINRGELSP